MSVMNGLHGPDELHTMHARMYATFCHSSLNKSPAHILHSPRCLACISCQAGHAYLTAQAINKLHIHVQDHSLQQSAPISMHLQTMPLHSLPARSCTQLAWHIGSTVHWLTQATTGTKQSCPDLGAMSVQAEVRAPE